jgi:hypothetical protein
LIIYKSTDASAPTLAGVVGGAYSSGWAAGSLLELLRQILVVGYGSKAAAGWSLAYHGTSEGVFQQGAGCGFYLHMLDDGSATAGAKEASFNGGESYTAYNTGTALFPTSAQNSGKLYMRKSDTADSTVRPWICFADAKTFYLFTVPQHGSGTEYYAGMGFGDFATYYSGDAYNCIAIGRTTSASTDTLTNDNLDLTSVFATISNGHYVARGYAQAGASVAVGKTGGAALTNQGGTQALAAATGMPFPNPTDGKFYLGRCYIQDGTTIPSTSLRGYLRGFWIPMHNSSILPMEYTFTGSGSIAGRSFRTLGLRTGSNGRYVMETSDTWD